MSCKECEKAEESGMVAYYRWGKANIGLIGCKKHLREVINYLREAKKEN